MSAGPADGPRARKALLLLRERRDDLRRVEAELPAPPPMRDELARALARNPGGIRATAKQFGRDRRQI